MQDTAKQKVVLIVNPISGTRRKLSKQVLTDAHLDRSKFDFEIVSTGYAGHAVEIAAESSESGADIVVAVGGDGTVNEVARGLAGTGTPMGIVPCGSGNGLARHLGISMDPLTALRDLSQSHSTLIDYGIVNGHCFVTTCGLGFDALISQKFAEGKHRGELEYIKNVLHQLHHYKPENYRMTLDGEPMETKAFLMTAANANQWGNDAFIAPEASLQDGLLDVCIIRDAPITARPILLNMLLHKSLTKSSHYICRKCSHLLIEREGDTLMHCDGDPVVVNGNIDIRIVRNGLAVMLPDRSCGV